MIEITRSFGFDAGHRILGHESKCANLHGHRYTAEVSCSPAEGHELDPLGRVIDFSKVKKLVGGWIDEYWDHTMVLHQDDHLLKIHAFEEGGWDLMVFGPKPPYRMSCNPTAENMAMELEGVASGLLEPFDITVTQVKLWETPQCFAIYRKDK